ncbi:hypothetical protein SAMN02745911_3516 [Aureimonas altamirensis DSM 21988]|uniref:EthD domain-containing protein n=1 Tax=Aureimonas altamirensis DSM 21988 TaxID=1121026 RepID=A0ABY1IQ36_9HYPH|nr:hypothetical protein [Aureimonas altamirensis]SHJ83444.1 hypothetical protein SAMN02745911_3516 [Aureimonas altamirensis DSM 21988]
MIVRQAFFRGTITPGREAEFRAFVLDRLKPLWLTFPGMADLRIQFETTRDEGAEPIPLALAMVFPDAEALAQALQAPVRFESRGVTAELMQMFDGRIEHHVFDAA